MKRALTDAPTDVQGRYARWGAAALLLLVLGFLVYRALTGRVLYWDGCVYLVDARSIGGAVRGYWYLHAPLTPMLHIPGVMLADAGPAAGPLTWVGPQFNALLITVSLLVVLFLWTRKWLGAGWGLLAVLLFAGGRACVHYGATPMADIPSALFATLALVAYPATSASVSGGFWRVGLRWARFGLFVGAAMLAKFPMVILPAPFVLAELLRSLAERRVDWRRWLGLTFSGLVGAAVFLGALAGVHVRVFGGVVFREVIEGLQEATGIIFEETVRDYLRMLPIMVSPVTLGLAGLGLFVVWRQRLQEHAATVLWVLFCVAFFSLGVVHNEFRYLMPVLPALAFLATFGARWLLEIANARATTPLARRLIAGAGLALVAVTLVPGVRQALRDLHPFFSSGAQEDLGNFIVKYCPEGGTVFSETGAVQLAPPLPLLALEDEFYDLFTIGDPYITFVTRRTWKDVGRRTRHTGESFLDTRAGPGGVIIHPEQIRLPAAIGSESEAPITVAAVSGERRWTLEDDDEYYIDEHGGRRLKGTAGSDGPPTIFAASGRRKWLLKVDGDRYIDNRGESRFRFEALDGKLRLTSIGLEGDIEILDKHKVPLVRRQIRLGDVLEIGTPNAARPPPLIMIERETRSFPAVWERTSS